MPLDSYDRSMSLSDVLRRRIRAASGLDPCDVVLRNVKWLDVFSCEFVAGDVAIKDGVIVGVEPGGIVVVRFASDGSERKLMAEYAPISKR